MSEGNLGLVDQPVKLIATLAVMTMIAVGIMAVGGLVEGGEEAEQTDVMSVEKTHVFEIELGSFDWNAGESYRVDVGEAILQAYREANSGIFTANLNGLPEWMEFVDNSGQGIVHHLSCWIVATPDEAVQDGEYWMTMQTGGAVIDIHITGVNVHD